jgi:hypothetical protein
MGKEEAIKSFFDVALKGESKTYNDHNWYICTGGVKKCLKGYIEGRGKSPYPKLTKVLSSYTLGEVKKFQSNSRSGSGQLFATGRYQIIPNTLKGIIAKSGLNDSDKYNAKNQDRLALQLLLNRPSLKAYILGESEDNQTNLDKASTQMAMIWSSIGVPYAMKGGRKSRINKDDSYYSGGGDKASVKSDTIQTALKTFRKDYNNSKEDNTNESVEKKKYLKYFLIATTIIAIGSGVAYYFLIYKKKNK